MVKIKPMQEAEQDIANGDLIMVYPRDSQRKRVGFCEISRYLLLQSRRVVKMLDVNPENQQPECVFYLAEGLSMPLTPESFKNYYGYRTLEKNTGDNSHAKTNHV